MTTPKVEITDDLVQRFLKVIVRHGWRVLDETPAQARATLDELLNPPTEPDIPVSEAMINAGMAAQCEITKPYLATETLAYVYRAMEQARRNERILHFPDRRFSHTHFRAGEHGFAYHGRKSDSYLFGHGRKDDPK